MDNHLAQQIATWLVSFVRRFFRGPRGSVGVGGSSVLEVLVGAKGKKYMKDMKDPGGPR